MCLLFGNQTDEHRTNSETKERHELMSHDQSIVDLVAGYGAYASVDELNVHAAVDAPATTPVCAATVAVSVASSTWCASGAVSAAGGATFRVQC